MTLSFVRKRDDLDGIFANDINELQVALEEHDADKADQTALTSHVNDHANPHTVTKAQIGLGSVDNTADIDKPISSATQAALDTHTTNTSNPHSVTKAQVGLGSVDNTADADKPISIAVQTALNAKAPQTSVDAITPNALGQLVAGASTGTVVRIPMGAVGTSLRPTSTGLQYLNLVVLHVDDFGAKGDGLANNDTAIANAIAAGKALGNSNNYAQGCVIVFGPGAYSIRNPIVLPRNGLAPTNVVQLVGTGMRSTAIIGHSTLFPAARALVEWEATASRIWHNRIANMRLHVPTNIHPDCAAVRHTPVNALTSNATVITEWMQCDFENLLITGSNDVKVFIDLGVGNRYARMVNIYGDPSPGNGTYDTILIKTPTDYTGGGVGLGDAMGIGFCTVENVTQTIRSGGYGAVFSGRTYVSKWSVSFANGGRTQVPYEFINSWNGTFDNFGCEGRSEPAQIRLVNCFNMEFRQVSIGTPNPAYNGWSASHVYAVGDQVVQNALIAGNGATSSKVWQCTVAGTSSGVEPAWTNTLNDTITDGTVTWQAVRDAVGVGVSLESGTHDCYFVGRNAEAGNIRFSSYMSKVVRISADSKRNVFERYMIRGNGDGNPTAEIQIDAPASNFNHISGVDFGTGGAEAVYALGSHMLRPSATAVLDFPSIAAQNSAQLTMTVSGARVNDVVELGAPPTIETGLDWRGYVSANDTVTIRLFNMTASPIDPAAATWRATVRRTSS